MRFAALSVVFAGAVVAVVATQGCGTPCADDRCSLAPSKPQVNRVDYTKKSSGSSSTATGDPTPSGSGSAVASGSGSGGVATAGSAGVGSASAGSAAPAGSGSAPVATGSGAAKPAAGSGSAAPVTPVTPPAPSTSATSWERDANDQFKMTLASKQSVAASTTIRVEQVKTPTKTPYVITLQVKPPGGSPGPEAAWNDCPENKIVCDPGTKTHSTKKNGVVLIQAGINWAITAVTDDGKGTLVTWTNNLSREVLQLRLSK